MTFDTALADDLAELVYRAVDLSGTRHLALGAVGVSAPRVCSGESVEKGPVWCSGERTSDVPS